MMLRMARFSGSILRVAAALALAYVVLPGLPTWDAWRAIDELPDYDYLGEAESLRSEQRFSEALLVLEAGEATNTADHAQKQRYDESRQRVIADRDDWRRKLGDLGEGALTGIADSPEALAGAIAADLVVWGDIRDLVVQAGRALNGDEVDEVLVGLSAAGIVLTVTPSIDFGTALLKAARRVGALSERFARQLFNLSREAFETRDVTRLTEVAEDSYRLGSRAGPAVAMRILPNVDDAVSLKRAAELAQQPSGAFALWVGGRPAMTLAQQGPEVQSVLVRAARKGRPGIDAVAQRLPYLLRPHPWVGLAKTLYRHDIPRWLNDWLIQRTPVLGGLALGWLLFELAALLLSLVGERSGGGRRQPTEPKGGDGFDTQSHSARLEPRL